jgi:hypothetical protein
VEGEEEEEEEEEEDSLVYRSAGQWIFYCR